MKQYSAEFLGSSGLFLAGVGAQFLLRHFRTSALVCMALRSRSV